MQFWGGTQAPQPGKTGLLKLKLFSIVSKRMRVGFLLFTLSRAWECPSPVILRYMRIQSKPFLNQLYTHTTSKVMSSFVPHDTAALSVLQDTVYEFVENKTMSIDPKEVTTFFVRQFVIQAITHEVTDVVHEAVNDVVKKMTST